MFATKRIYDPPSADDGYRVLVERLWPRGMTKEKAKLDDWAKPLAPSDALRRWYAQDETKWAEFGRRYRKELDQATAADGLADIRRRGRSGRVTLLYAKADPVRNSAAILRDVLAKER